MINGVKLPDKLIEETKEVNIKDIIYNKDDYKKMLKSEYYPLFVSTFEDEIDNTYITLYPLGKDYVLVDGMKRFMFYRDQLNSKKIRAAIMKPADDVMWYDVSMVLRDPYNKKNLSSDLDRLQKAVSILKAYMPRCTVDELSLMLDISSSNVYRLSKNLKNTNKQLLKVCLERDVSVRSVEAISTMNPMLQEGLYNQFVSDETFVPSEKLIKLIKEEGAIFDSGTPIQTEKIPNRTLGKAKKDRAIIEKAIEHDRQRGIQIKDIKNISSKIAISNLIGKQEDAVRALENRLYKIKYEANEIDIARIQNVVLRLNEVIELLRENQSSD